MFMGNAGVEFFIATVANMSDQLITVMLINRYMRTSNARFYNRR